MSNVMANQTQICSDGDDNKETEIIGSLIEDPTCDMVEDFILVVGNDESTPKPDNKPHSSDTPENEIASSQPNSASSSFPNTQSVPDPIINAAGTEPEWVLIEELLDTKLGIVNQSILDLKTDVDQCKKSATDQISQIESLKSVLLEIMAERFASLNYKIDQNDLSSSSLRIEVKKMNQSSSRQEDSIEKLRTEVNKLRGEISDVVVMLRQIKRNL